METRVKITKFYNEKMATLSNFFRQSFTANVLACSSIFLHNFALFLFDDEIGLNQWKNIIQHWSSCLPVVYWSRKFLLTGPSVSRIFMSTKHFFKPDNQLFIAASYLKHAMPLITTAILSLLGTTNIYATFSIDNTCKISDFCDRVISFKKNSFSHEFPFDNYYTVINESVHAERLNEKALKGDAIV